MRRHRKTVVVVTTLVVGWFPSMGAAEAPIERIEYKLRLSVPRFVTDGPKAVQRLLGADAAFEAKKCRLVRFLDVAGDHLQGGGSIVRHRAELDVKECPASLAPDTKTKDPELTLKFRTGDADRLTNELESKWWQDVKARGKVEQDIGLSATSDGRLVVGRAYSASADAAGEAPTTVADLRKAFSDAVAPAFAADAALAPSGGSILEDRWKLKPTGEAELPKEIDLVAWSCVGKGGAKSAAPFLAELSFKVEGKTKEEKADARRRADALVMRLVATLDSAWLAEGGSKTEAAAACKGE